MSSQNGTTFSVGLNVTSKAAAECFSKGRVRQKLVIHVTILLEIAEASRVYPSVRLYATKLYDVGSPHRPILEEHFWLVVGQNYLTEHPRAVWIVITYKP